MTKKHGTNTVTVTQEMVDKRPLVIDRHGNIETMAEEDARAIFGDEFYEAWLKSKRENRPTGTCTVVAIDRAGATITVGGWSGMVIPTTPLPAARRRGRRR